MDQKAYYQFIHFWVRKELLYIPLATMTFHMPLTNVIDTTPALTNSNDYHPEKLVQLVKGRPTLLWFSSIIGLSPDLMMDLMCLIGTLVGLIITIMPRYGHKMMFILLWVFYQSLYQVSPCCGNYVKQRNIITVYLGWTNVFMVPMGYTIIGGWISLHYSSSFSKQSTFYP